MQFYYVWGTKKTLWKNNDVFLETRIPELRSSSVSQFTVRSEHRTEQLTELSQFAIGHNGKFLAEPAKALLYKAELEELKYIISSDFMDYICGIGISSINFKNGHIFAKIITLLNSNSKIPSTKLLQSAISWLTKNKINNVKVSVKENFQRKKIEVTLDLSHTNRKFDLETSKILYRKLKYGQKEAIINSEWLYDFGAFANEETFEISETFFPVRTGTRTKPLNLIQILVDRNKNIYILPSVKSFDSLQSLEEAFLKAESIYIKILQLEVVTNLQNLTKEGINLIPTVKNNEISIQIPIDLRGFPLPKEMIVKQLKEDVEVLLPKNIFGESEFQIESINMKDTRVEFKFVGVKGNLDQRIRVHNIGLQNKGVFYQF